MTGFKDAVKSGMDEYLVELKTKLEGLTEAELYWHATLDSNSIAWLVWHMARVEDGWINSTIAGGESVWDSGGWAGRTGVTYDSGGYGQTAEEARSMPVVDVGCVDRLLRCCASGGIQGDRRYVGRRSISELHTWQEIGHMVVDTGSCAG